MEQRKRKLGKLGNLPSLTKTFQELANCPDRLSFAMDERFVVILYRISKCKFVNEARKKLFAT